MRGGLADSLVPFLDASPLGWLAVTLGLWTFAHRLQHLAGGRGLFNPILMTIAFVSLLLLALHVPYASYVRATLPLTMLLGPATVALAVPLAANVVHIRDNLRAVLLALGAGSFTSLVTGVAIVHVLGGSRAVMLSMAPKAMTSPIAMAVARETGGIPSLTAVLAILGGVLAALLGPPLLALLRIPDPRAHGFAAGLAGSGVAVAEVARSGEIALTFGGLGIALNGMTTAITIPVLIEFWH